MIEHFCDWLSNTQMSLTIQTVDWIIPAVQTIHILCVALVMSSMAMLDLRLMRLAGVQKQTSKVVARFVPWVWYVIPVLLGTGAILIIGEPSRELLNPYFRAKMVMLAAVGSAQGTRRRIVLGYSQDPGGVDWISVSASVDWNRFGGPVDCILLRASQLPTPNRTDS